MVQDDGKRKKKKNLRRFCLNLQIRDCRQIIFVALNGFCPWSRTPHHSLPLSPSPPPPTLHVLNEHYQDGKNTKKSMKNTCPFYIVFQVLKVRLIKVCKIQPPDLLFLVVFISFYISRYHFSQIFRTSFNIVWKKDFRHEFSILMRMRTIRRIFPTMVVRKVTSI